MNIFKKTKNCFAGRDIHDYFEQWEEQRLQAVNFVDRVNAARTLDDVVLLRKELLETKANKYLNIMLDTYNTKELHIRLCAVENKLGIELPEEMKED